MRQRAILLLGALLLAACQGCKTHTGAGQTCTIRVGERTYELSLAKYADNNYSIISTQVAPRREKISEWGLNYPVYRFACADVNGDGVTDILAGVEKRTRFDSAVRRRLFIFRLSDGYVRPMWLGSTVSQPLYDFVPVKVNDSLTIVRTIEYEQNGSYLVADYRWKGFGLAFIRYEQRNCTLSVAEQSLTEKDPYAAL